MTNVGDGTATGVSVTVTTGDRGDRHAALAVLRRPAAGRDARADFTLALAATYPLGKRVQLSVRVTFAGVLSPTTATLQCRRASRPRPR